MAVGPDVTRFMNSVRSRLTGAIDAVIQQELFTVMDDFFKGSNTWQQNIEITIPGMDPSGTIYYLTSDTPSVIDKLMWAFEKPHSVDFSRGPQIGCAMQIPGSITLDLQPNSPTTYIFTVALTVQDPLTRDGYVTFPAWVLAKYRNTIMDGVLGRMMSQPSKPYTNNQMAVFHMRKFNIGVAHARVEMTRNNKYRQQAWSFPGFARGSQRGRSGWSPPQ